MIIDILVLIVLFISAGIAFLRGFIREALTIAGMVGGLIAAHAVGPHLAVLMRGWLGVKEGEEVQKLFDMVPYTLVADILAYGGIFVVVVIGLSIVSHYLAESARNIGLGAVDRTLGVIFGILRGVVVLGLLYLPVYALVEKDVRDHWFEGSKTHFYIEKTAMAISGYLPDGIAMPAVQEGQTQGDALKNIGVLGSEEKKAAPADPAAAPGYSEEFRQNMDQLIEEQQVPLNGASSYNE